MIKIIVPAVVSLLCPLAPAQTANLDALLAQTSRWESNVSRQPLLAVSQMVAKAQGSAPQTHEIEQKFIAFLKSDATLAGKDFICKQLSVMGSEASVPVLSGMLADSKTADMGRYALERIPGPTVDKALRDALGKTSGKTRIGIINSLGQRRDSASVALLRPLALGSQAAEAQAALFALGRIADTTAIAALDAAQAKTTGAVRATAREACLQAADRLTARGNTAAALPIYKKLYEAAEPATVRAAALRGLGAAGGAESTPVLMAALHGNDLRLQAIAVGALMPRAAGQLTAEMPKLSEAARVRILGLLSERGDASALPAFTAALNSPSKPVRIAALQGIANVGNASLVPVLAGVAASGDDAERNAARASLAQIRGKDVDQMIADSLRKTSDSKVKLELIRAAGERGTVAAAPALLESARDSNDEIRRESLRALRDAGTASEIPGLVALVVKPADAGDRTEAARSLSVVRRRSDSSRIQDVVSAYAQAGDVETRAALLQVMGQSGHAQALPVVRGALKDENAEIKRAAILALTEWSDAVPVPDLLETARTTATPAHQVLALRGALKLIGLPDANRPPAETVKLLASAMSLAKQVEEKRAILSLLQRFPVKEALDLARASVDDNSVAAEAKQAVSRIERVLK